jgi:hypothetical protein
VKASKLKNDACISFTHLVCIGLDGCDILHISRSVSSNDDHTLLRLRKICIWLRKGYVGYRKIWWGHGYTTPPCLHWYITIVTRRRRNSSKWWHIILLRTSFLGCGRTFSYNPSSFIFFADTRSPFSNQSSFPSKKS